MAWHGKFKPRNPQKYVGDATGIVYRSSLELRVMKYLDDKPDVISWFSEELAIPYYDPSRARMRRYFPDFGVKLKKKDGSIKNMIWEVKPYIQTKAPKSSKRVTKRYIVEVTTYATNVAKWDAARAWCQERGYEFMIVTDKDILGGKDK